MVADMRFSQGHLVRVLCAALAVVAFGAGCNGDDDASSEQPASTTSSRPPDETTTTVSGPVLDLETQTRLLTAANRLERAWLLGRRFPSPDDLFASCENVLSPEVSVACTDPDLYVPVSDTEAATVGIEVTGKLGVGVTQAADETWWCIGTLGEPDSERVWGNGKNTEEAVADCAGS